MIRARISIVSTALFLAVTGVMLISATCFSQNLPTNWEVKYVNLKDDLRALALDPLNPSIIYLGSDQAVIGSSDEGNTWTPLQSFRDNKFSLSSADSPEATKALLLISEIGGKSITTAASGEKGSESGFESDAVVEARRQLAEAKQQVEQLKQKEVDNADALRNAKSQLEKANKILAEAVAALEEWTPDDLTISQVEAETDYDQLGEWLEERGLDVPSDIQERRDVLIDYLEKHAEEGVKLKEAVEAAQEVVDAAKEKVAALEESQKQIEDELKKAQAAEEAAQRKLDELLAQSQEATGETGEEGASSEEEAEDIDVTGVSYIAIDPSNSAKIYLSTFNGMYRSEDSGAKWEKIYQGGNPSQSAGLCIAIDPSNPDVVYLGTLSGIALSSDGGGTWSRPAGRISDKVITSLEVHPFDSQVVLAGTSGKGIFKSSDGGATWISCFTKASQEANVVLSIKFAPSQPQIIYAGTMSGTYYSADGGESWESASGMGLGSTVEVRDLIISPTDPEIVYLATRRGVFGTTDGGQQWRRLTFGLTFKGSNFLAFDPLNASTVWMISDNRAFKSTAPRFLDLSSGETTVLVGGGEITTDGSERHTILIESIDEDTGTATIIIQSEPQTLKLKVGESADVDLTGNGEDDLVITMESITDGVPKFSVSKVASATIPGEEDVIEKLSPDEITGLEDLDPYFRAEPTWVEVQQAASRWAEVHPEKIAAWRQGISLRAFLPEVDFDYSVANRQLNNETNLTRNYEREDRDQGWDASSTSLNREGNEYDTDYDTTDGGVFTYEDKDYDYSESDQSLGQDSGYGDRDVYITTSRIADYNRETPEWGLELSWELGDFLYNKEQLKVSKEARNLVELRQDVLEQVTLYFFDRRTARIDMILTPPADAYSRVEMLLQIQQLDASLDAMTGGYFTNTIKEREKSLKR